MAAKHGVRGNATRSGQKVAAIHGRSFTSPLRQACLEM
jgi:hypothetical protein